MSNDDETRAQRPAFTPAEGQVIYPEAFQKAPPAPPAAPRRTRAAAKKPAPRPKVDYATSRTPRLEAAFRAALVHAQKQGVPGLGGCMNMWDEKSADGSYFTREGALRLGAREFTVTLYSLARPPGKDERDETFGQFRVHQGIARIEDGSGQMFDVYTALKGGVPQVDSHADWTVVNRNAAGRTMQRSFAQFLAAPIVDPDAITVETTPPPLAAGGFSFGALALPRDRRNLQVVLAPVDNSQPGVTAAPTKPTRKKTRKRVKTRGKTVQNLTRRAKPKRANPGRNTRPKPKPKR